MNRNMHLAPAASDSAGAPDTKDLAQENEELKKQLSGISEEERSIRKRMAAGLTREQAEAVVKHQAAYDLIKAEVALPRTKGRK